MSDRNESKRQLKQQYKEEPKRAGIFLITNTANGKVFLGSSKNLNGPLNKHQFALKYGGHMNASLQADWKKFGPNAFKFEIVDEVEVKDDPGFSLNEELELLEQAWLEKTQPVGERGYNINTRIRE